MKQKDKKAAEMADKNKPNSAVIRDITSDEMLMQLRDEKQLTQLVNIVRQLLKDD